MAEMQTPPASPQSLRPMSPHLQIYRWQMSNSLSILHRLTGVVLSGGVLLFASWLWGLAYCPMWTSILRDIGGSIVGQVMLFGWSVAFFYHFGNGIRHLFWDMGKGFSLPAMHRSGVFVILFAIIMTALLWIVAWNI